MFDLNDAFYRPLWLRVLLVVLTLGWGLFEFISGAPFFGVIFTAIGLYAAWRFFVTFDPPDGAEEDR
ncbi:hypothetical protein SAMN04489859_100565 [Paracoccus alcaliphilus]|uniref:DUF3329 domain-containing protein n=1 Tax=Paracoccus alcaliphilus TaxID=34002 RepID=A0A1H8FXV3_9RHOB|nr:hypothetical protein [Paracoccus alcaliphilus]WCR20253.1 DUF3329 domain-containing protein [Paracoccus alcaliphilus]SEN36532.1 hypothetical protein SAMN04489859_100565 [Paracoccus alcaliphilus]